MELSRQFQFYDIIPIRDPRYGSPDDSLFSNAQLSSICATPSYLVFNCNTTIKILNDQFELVAEFESYDLSYNLIKIQHVNQTTLLATIGEKVGSPSLLKIWDLNKIIKSPESINKHSYHSQVEIANGDNNFPITSFDCNTDFNLLVFGFSNGNVVLVRGDIIHDKGSRQRLIYQDIDPITGVFLMNDVVYVTTISKILTMPTNGKTQPIVFLDKKLGAELGNSTFNKSTRHLVIANGDNIIFYNHLQKLSTLQLSFQKKRVYNLVGKEYLLVVSPVSSASTTTRLVILDYDAKQIILNKTISSTVKEIFEWNNDLYILSNEGLLFRLVEKPIQQQLDIIMAKNLYPIANELASKHGLDTSEIHHKYATYLYEHQQFDEAMTEYINCLNKTTETSEVIKKFKNNQNLHNLIRYLYKMLQIKLANSDHLTLLMCCYIKLKMKDDLSKLVKDLNRDTKFDLNTVIQLCRDSQFYEIATKLASVYEEYQLIIDIQMNDVGQYDNVLKFCRMLSINDLLTVLLSSQLNLVKTLLDKKPREMTNLLIDIFTGEFKSQEFDENLFFQEDIPDNTAREDAFSDERPTYLPPKPRLIFKNFVKNEDEFVFFLESCLKSYEKFKGDVNDQKDLVITLFEIYISLYSKTSEEDWATKAKQLVKANEELVDMNQLLLLCQLNDFNLDDDFYDEKNLIELYRSYTLAQELDKSIELLHKHGSKEHQLFKFALRFYCSSEKIYEQVSEEEFQYLFDSIKKYKVLTPLEIIEIMSLNDVSRIGILRATLLDHVSTVRKNIDKNEKLIKSYGAENDKLKQEIKELTTTASTIQPTKCSTCKQPLKLPVVHFKCSHSYHLTCLSDLAATDGSESVSGMESTYECPLCATKKDEIESLRRQHEETADRNDLFLNVLNNEENDDNLQIISEFIGRGSLENLRYVVS